MKQKIMGERKIALIKRKILGEVYILDAFDGNAFR